MSRNTEFELRQISERLREQCERVLLQVGAAAAVVGGAGRPGLDPRILERDIDREEVQLEESCLRVMALHHPVGSDLRYLVTVLRSNGDLERMADHALVVVEGVQATAGPLADPTRLLARQVESITRRAVQALLERDPRSAQGVQEEHAAVQRLAEASWGAARQRASSGVYGDLDLSFLEIRLGQELRRIGDLACNLSEDVLYLEGGRIVRHGGFAA